MFWFEPVMNLISMLFHDWLVVESHWMRSGDPSSVTLGVRGDTVVDVVDDCRLAWLGTATTAETLVRATKAQGARVAVKNFMVARSVRMGWMMG